MTDKAKPSFSQLAAQVSWILPLVGTIFLAGMGVFFLASGSHLRGWLVLGAVWLLMLVAGGVLGVIGCLGSETHDAKTTLVPGVIGLAMNGGLLALLFCAGVVAAVLAVGRAGDWGVPEQPYRPAQVILLDLAADGTPFNTVAAGLNQVQSQFVFVAVSGPAFPQAVHEVNGHANFCIDEVPARTFAEVERTPHDLILAFVRQPLTARDVGSNFISVPGPQRKHLVFVSTAWNRQNAAAAGCTQAEVISHEIAARLACECLDGGFHAETRSCPMDYCQQQTLRVFSLRKRKFCAECLSRFADRKLAAVLQSILDWREPAAGGHPDTSSGTAPPAA